MDVHSTSFLSLPLHAIFSPMQLSSKDRAFLRGEAQTIDPVVMVGKEGLTEAVVLALAEALKAHELVKVKFQNHKDEVKEIATRLEELTRCDLVATTGFTAVYYKRAEDPDKRKYRI